MKGMERSFEGSWNISAESCIENSDERLGDFTGKLNFVKTYVNEIVANEKVVESLIGQGLASLADDEEGAYNFLKNNKQLLPGDLADEGESYHRAFILALAKELSKPQYNH
ncbi:hypothetical protein KC845_03195 [Candidatus Kaiserbacteria bacterium]|nr:hypothetical protein [Candidatus Kaiserbacteria bacterium]